MQQYGFVFAGDRRGYLNQYRLEPTGGVPTIVKEYGRIDIGQIYSSVSVGNLAVFGGEDKRLVVIATDMQQVVIYDVPVAIKHIFSLSMCPVRVSDTKTRVLLAVSGGKADYSNDRSDLLDVTPCLQGLGVSVDTADLSATCLLHDQLQQLRAELDAADSTVWHLQAELDAANNNRQALQAEYERCEARFRRVRRELQSIKSVQIEPALVYNGTLTRLAKTQRLLDRWECLRLRALRCSLYVWVST